MIFIQKRCPLSTLNALFSKFYMASVMASLEELMQARHRCILGCRLQGRLDHKTPSHVPHCGRQSMEILIFGPIVSLVT